MLCLNPQILDPLRLKVFALTIAPLYYFFILDSVLSFDVDNKPAFEIPLKDVSAATTGMSW